jgi:hypothetical protein
LNLKTAVVKTINILADELYQFDENGVCIRKNLEPLGEAEIENPYTQIVEYEEKLDDEKADEIHAGMDRVMNSYWKKAFPNQMQQSRFQHNTSQQIENEIENLKIITGKYIDLYVNVRAACSGRIRFAPNGNVFKEYDELRQILEARMLSDLPFKDYLRELEEEGWMLFISGKRNPSKGKKLVSKYVDKFKEDSDKLRKAARSEFDKIQNKNFKETELEGTESNITELYKQCESLAENMLAVILKIEADKEKKKQDSPAP